MEGTLSAKNSSISLVNRACPAFDCKAFLELDIDTEFLSSGDLHARQQSLSLTLGAEIYLFFDVIDVIIVLFAALLVLTDQVSLRNPVFAVDL